MELPRATRDAASRSLRPEFGTRPRLHLRGASKQIFHMDHSCRASACNACSRRSLLLRPVCTENLIRLRGVSESRKLIGWLESLGSRSIGVDS
jgi:hypothetical protein